MRELKKEETIIEEETAVFPIGPKSSFTLYQLMFNGGGVTMSTGVTASKPKPMCNVTISCQVIERMFIKHIDAIFTDDSVARPKNLILEISGGDPDINSRFGLHHSWLVPVWTTSKVS